MRRLVLCAVVAVAALVGCSDDAPLRAEIEEGNRTIASLNETVASLNETVASLNTDLDDAGKTIQEQQESIAGLETANTTLQTDKDAELEGQRAKLETALAEAVSEHSALKDLLDEAQSDLAETQAALNDSQAGAAALQAASGRVKTLGVRAAELEGRIAALQEQYDSLQEQYDSLQDDYRALLEELGLSVPGNVPEHLVWGVWAFHAPVDSLEIDIEIHNDVQFAGRNGYYFMTCHARIGGTSFYMGLQTDIQHPVTFRGTGKGVIFSRWDTRDLADTRVASGGFAQSSGHEGDFVGVRLNYEWGAGWYTLTLSPQEHDEGGLWHGLWVQGADEAEATWVGSLRFPRGGVDHCYTTVEVYGSSIRPMDLPYWEVSIEPPRSGSSEAYLRESGHNLFTDDHYLNVKGRLEEDELYLEVGGVTVRQLPRGWTQ